MVRIFKLFLFLFIFDIFLSEFMYATTTTTYDRVSEESIISKFSSDYANYNYLNSTYLGSNSDTHVGHYKVFYNYNYNITRELYKDSNDKEYVFEYDELDKSFILKNFDDKLDYDLGDVFQVPQDFGISRVALFRSFPSGKKVYGYENAHHNMVSASGGGVSNLLNAVYTLNFKNFDSSFTQDLCMNSLATYNPKSLTNGNTKLSYIQMVGCKDHDIILNSESIDRNFVEGRAFNLFKNIVTNLKNE